MQRNLPPLSFVFLVVFSFILAGCGVFSLASDVTPPPDYTPQPAPIEQPVNQPIVASTAFPLLPPDPVAGKAVFTTKCEPCHGPLGLGDGPKAGNLPERPPLIGGRDLAIQSKPADWFTIVTEGNLEKFMPGFKAGLDDRQRWDVISYVLTLSQTPDELAAGKKIYEDQCSDCHGVKGQGDGAIAVGKEVPNWAKQERLARLSAQDISAIIAAGQGNMPAFNNLSEEDRLALAIYIRNLTYSSSDQKPVGSESENSSTSEPGSSTPNSQPTNAAPADQADAPVVTLVIQGKIMAQGDDIGTGGLPVKLLGFEGMNQTLEQETTSSAEGNYEFKVDNKAGMAYMVQVDYEGNPYNSDILHSQDVFESPANLPVVIYPTTTDASALTIDRMHVFFDFSLPGKVQIAELFILSNAGQAVVVSNDPENPAVAFRLPAGAADLQFQGGALGDRFVETKDGFGDLSAVEPGQGQHQVLFSYTLPYEKKLDLAIPVPMDAAAAVVMMPEGGVRIQSSQLTDAGSRDVQGVPYNLYSASNLSAGSDLAIKLSGNAGGVGSQPESTTSGMVIGLGVFGLVLIGAGIWLFRARGAQTQSASVGSDITPVETETEDGLLDAILALDDLHRAGEIPEAAYQQRRADLKARLKALKGH